MSDLSGFGMSRLRPNARAIIGTELVQVQRPLDPILGHLNYSIDDVVNDRTAKHAVLGYFKLSRQVTRRCEIVDLERQWNPI
jgi:hypothetical protein